MSVGATQQAFAPLALFERFPLLAARVPRVPFGAWPTPVERIAMPGFAGLWVKREDLSSPRGGGNKVRKLELTLADAVHGGYRKIVTYGGLGTNHGLATATFGRTLGLATRLLLYRQPVTEQVMQTLLDLHELGAELRCHGSLLRAGVAFYTTQRVANPGAYFLTAGGSSPLGTVGVVNSMFELRGQVDAGLLPEPDVIFCALGSGGTMAGLSLGALLTGMKSKVVGVRVSPDRFGPVRFTDATSVRRLMVVTLRLMRRHAPSIPAVEIPWQRVLDDYFGTGYGVSTPEGSKAMAQAHALAGLDLDGTYTAKTFAAVTDYIGRREHSSETVLFWHTHHSALRPERAAARDYRRLPSSLHWVFEQAGGTDSRRG